MKHFHPCLYFAFFACFGVGTDFPFLMQRSVIALNKKAFAAKRPNKADIRRGGLLNGKPAWYYGAREDDT